MTKDSAEEVMMCDRVRLAVGAIVCQSGKVVLVRKTKAMDTHGGPTTIDAQWGFPMGGVFDKEDLEVAVRRELYEETNIRNVGQMSKLRPYIFKLPDFYRENTGFSRQHVTMFLVEFSHDEQLRSNCEEIDDVRFFELDEALEILTRDSSRIYLTSVLTAKT